MAVSVILGSIIVSASDDRVSVWSAAHDLATGTTVTAQDFEEVQVRLDDPSPYVNSKEAIPVGRQLNRAVGARELVPITALSSATSDRRLVTLPVEPMRAPLDLGHGDRVDVYVSPRDSNGAPAASKLVLAGALVYEVSNDSDSATGEIAVVVDLAATEAAGVVGASRSGAIDLVRVPVSSP